MNPIAYTPIVGAWLPIVLLLIPTYTLSPIAKLAQQEPLPLACFLSAAILCFLKSPLPFKAYCAIALALCPWTLFLEQRFENFLMASLVVFAVYANHQLFHLVLKSTTPLFLWAFADSLYHFYGWVFPSTLPPFPTMGLGWLIAPKELLSWYHLVLPMLPAGAWGAILLRRVFNSNLQHSSAPS